MQLVLAHGVSAADSAVSFRHTSCTPHPGPVVPALASGSMGDASDVAFLQSQYKKERTKNVNEIRSACENNMELQALVLKYIRNYNSGVGGSIGQQLEVKAATPKRRGSCSDDLTAEDISKMFGKNSELKRGRFLYKNWGPALLRELLFFAVPGMKRSTVRKVKDEERLKECLEFAWDIRCTESSFPLDRIGATDKKELFEAFRTEYVSKGCRLDNLMSELAQGWIDWKIYGHFSMNVVKGRNDEPPVITVTLKVDQTTATVPKELIAHDDWTTCELKNNHSWTSAFMMSASKETYTIKSLFPQFFKKGLKRSNSTAGITSPFEDTGGKIVKRSSDAGGTPDSFVGMALPVGVPPLAEPSVKAEKGADSEAQE